MPNLQKSGTNYNDVGNLSFDTDFLAVGPQISEPFKKPLQAVTMGS